VPSERLVHGVVDNLINQVVEAHLARGSDVHRGAQAHGLKTLENLDVLGGVVPVRAVRLLGFRLLLRANWFFHFGLGCC
jgi:hypothetical protein